MPLTSTEKATILQNAEIELGTIAYRIASVDEPFGRPCRDNYNRAYLIRALIKALRVYSEAPEKELNLYIALRDLAGMSRVPGPDIYSNGFPQLTQSIFNYNP